MQSIVERYTKTVVPEMKKKFGYRNAMMTPRLTKVVVSSGVGSQKDKERIASIRDNIGRVTGQKPVDRVAKKSIASFRVRQGTLSGYAVTLRKKRMNDFLSRLVNIALPRIRDFRGLPDSSIDAMGNLNIGIRDHTVFPEMSDEDVRSAFGLGITVVSDAKTKEEARALYELLGFPFTKKEGNPPSHEASAGAHKL